MKPRLGFLLSALLFLAGVLPLFASGGSEAAEPAGEVNVYSHRHYDVDRELYRRFTEETGIRVNVVEAGADELIQRLAAEGSRSPADLLVTVDAGRLYRAKEMGLLRPVRSDRLDLLVPEHLRDPEGHWYGLTVRARIVVYHRDRVDPASLTAYEDLADPHWKGRIAVRSSANVYNVSLLASLVANRGEDDARRWASGVVRNFARTPQGNDRDQVKAIASGEADLAIVNSYYVAHMLASQDAAEADAARQVEVLFPNQAGRGTHINVSGAGVTDAAPNPENAVRLIEFLLSDEAQELYARANFEYPVREGVPLAEEVAAWGDFAADDLNLSLLGEFGATAARIFDEVGWR